MPAIPAAHAQAAVRTWFDPIPVAFVALDPDAVWLDGSLEAAQAIRAAVAARE